MLPIRMVTDSPRVVVYGLSTSSDDRVRYVGQTIAPLKTRLRGHLRWARKGEKSALFGWIRKHLANGDEIMINPIVRDAVLHETEIQIIAFYRAAGAKLVNSTNGGEGFVGLPRSKEHQQKIADAQRGQKREPLSEEMKQRLSEILKTRVFSEEHRRRISEKRKAQGISVEAQKKMAEGRRNSPLWHAAVGRRKDMTNGDR